MKILNKKISQTLFFTLFRLLSVLVILILVGILGFIIVNGIQVINWEFLTSSPTSGMTKGGIFPAIVGTFYLIVGSMLFALPLGIAAGIYNVEFAGETKLIRFMRIMTNNLAGIPSVVFGLFGMTLFVNTLGFGSSLLAGSLTLGLLALPLIIRTTEEALKAVPDSYRLGSYALGASKLTTIRKIVLPAAFPNILTGIILSIGRVSGETAPILFTVAAYYLPHLPQSIFDQAMALPYHLYVLATSGTDIEAARPMAYGTALVLIAIVLGMNLFVSVMRRRFKKKNTIN